MARMAAITPAMQATSTAFIAQPCASIFWRAYRHVRNPMISGACCVLLGESVLAASMQPLGCFVLAVLVNVVYIPLSEEPGLVKRFGDDYLSYKRNVPRWIPRRTPWDGKEH